MPRSPQIDDLYAVVRPQDPTISPDGSRIVFVRAGVDREADRPHTELWEVRTDGSQPRRLTDGPGDAAPAFSPDGRWPSSGRRTARRSCGCCPPTAATPVG